LEAGFINPKNICAEQKRDIIRSFLSPMFSEDGADEIRRGLLEASRRSDRRRAYSLFRSEEGAEMKKHPPAYAKGYKGKRDPVFTAYWNSLFTHPKDFPWRTLIKPVHKRKEKRFPKRGMFWSFPPGY
jgi:hypothetical protein